MEKNVKKFPDLYKKTSAGSIQCWAVSVVENHDGTAVIVVDYGLWGTDSPQQTSDLISEGKNIGKKNETTAIEQAYLEAQSKWEKQKKKGYVESLEAAKSGEVDRVIEGGIVPMLAHSYSKHASKIKYPAYVQPKLDGIRCIAIMSDGKCTLWSRTRKPITGVPHIARELESAFPGRSLVFDGELYVHSYKTLSKHQTMEIEEGTVDIHPNQVAFEKIVSLVRQEVPGEGHEVVEYHVYDLPNYGGGFYRRAEALEEMAKNPGLDKVKIVQTDLIYSDDQLMEKCQGHMEQGYEGTMVRNYDGFYENKRSYGLQKIKEFEDSEFEIVGVEEGRGKLQGHVGAFVCKTKDGKQFSVKMSGSTERLREYFLDHSLWEGQLLTVKYQGLTNAESVPRFPIGICLRNYE